MLEAIRQFFGNHLEPDGAVAPAEAAPSAQDQDPLHIAACALLLELAHADDEFSDAERVHIEETLARHFALAPETAQELMTLADAERRHAVDLFQFTRLISERYDEGQKMVLAEVMWRLVYADGALAKHESYLMRKVSNLLELKPGYLAEARRRAVGDVDQ